MEGGGLPVDRDRISNLPPSIIHTILTLMPMRDAFRTSILSQNWRYHCHNIPKLCFADLGRRIDAALSPKCKLLHVVYPILLLHRGPILIFSLMLFRLKSCCEIDQIIIHLSRSATLEKFSLQICSGDVHKLPLAFFKQQQLTYLCLRNCAFQPPVTFKGFSRMVKLSFHNVSITVEVFLRLISNCPLLMEFTLINDKEHPLGSWSCNFLELFKCLPHLKRLCMSGYPVKCFATGFVAQKLPTSLVNLKCLHLKGLCFRGEGDLVSALPLVTSSNAEIIEMEMDLIDPTEVVSQNAINFIDYQDFCCVTLDHLRVIKITNFVNMKTGMDFVKFILARSPMLKKVGIGISHLVGIDGELKIVKELIQYPRASAKAEVMIN